MLDRMARPSPRDNDTTHLTHGSLVAAWNRMIRRGLAAPAEAEEPWLKPGQSPKFALPSRFVDDEVVLRFLVRHVCRPRLFRRESLEEYLCRALQVFEDRFASIQPNYRFATLIPQRWRGAFLRWEPQWLVGSEGYFWYVNRHGEPREP